MIPKLLNSSVNVTKFLRNQQENLEILIEKVQSGNMNLILIVHSFFSQCGFHCMIRFQNIRGR
ncbi:unnamed protein product, partial [Larinioides sclopetarius]